MPLNSTGAEGFESVIYRILPLIEFVLLVYCLQSDSSTVRGLSKGWWIVLIIFLPLAGATASTNAPARRAQLRPRSMPG